MRQTNWPTTSRHERGYGNTWSKVRLLVLRRDRGLCQCDKCRGGELRLMPATEVNHILPKSKGGTDDMDNLQAVARECHARITAEQQGKKRRPRTATGVDGYPIQAIE